MELKFEQDGFFEALKLLDNEDFDKIGFGISKMYRRRIIKVYNI